MQVTQFVATVEFIRAQYSELTSDLIFSHRLLSLLSEQLRGRAEKSEKADPRGSLGAVLKATTEMAVVRINLASHPFASDVLREFGLDSVLDENFILAIAEHAALAFSANQEKLVEQYKVLVELLEPISQRWKWLVQSVDPIKRLLIPKEVAEEKDFDEILTIELSYLEDVLPQPKLLADILNNAEQLYVAIATSMGKKALDPLSVIFIASGTSFRFDFRGLGEPIKELKHLLVEAWMRIRHRKAEDLHQNNQALLGSLEVLRQIDSDAKINVINPEEALRLHELVVRNTISLFEAGAYPREIPRIESVSNQALLHGIQLKLLPPAPPEIKEVDTNTKPKRRRRKKGSKRRSTSLKENGSGDPS